MRIAFAGTPEFARSALDALIAAGHTVPLVLTQPDRPAGRGLKSLPSAVKKAAVAAGIPVIQPRGLRADGRFPDDATAARDALLRAAPQLMVVAAYGLILPRAVLALPPYGCFNIHASLLPRWRGAAPIQRAIEAGDACTGITIMRMDDGLDTGDMVVVNALPIDREATAASLHDALALLGARSVLSAIAALEAGTLTATPQPASGITYATKLRKSEAPLDFSAPVALLERRIRAFNPIPGATMPLPGLREPVKVWRACVLPGAAQLPPGHVQAVSAQGIDVAAVDGVLRILELQKAGGRRQPVAQFVRGWQYSG
ncbi:MAG: methionyl-tRNA formyltransferase [Candidimonas sp.]|nr:MAG: methionyl-tRNA formyltransferase [Candidimonas sp.]